MQAQTNTPILVTGATGYIASHLIKILLENGHKVRGTVRSLANKDKYNFLYALAPEKNSNLELVEAELTNKESWLPAVEGCEYVFHVASPIPPYVPKDENELIVPAVEGTMNVLEAALAKSAKRVVVTSSCLTMFFGNAGRVLSEEDWSKEELCPAYPKSKVRAEKAAWKFYEEHKDKLEVVVVNPALVLGPTFTKHGNSSEALLAEILKGSYPGIMDLTFTIVDVRDAAMAHYKAMFTKEAAGKRIAAAAGPLTQETIVNTLKSEFGKYGYQISDKHVTAEEVVASGNPVAQRSVGMIGKKMEVTNERSVKLLGMTYLPVEKTVVDMAHSLIKTGAVEDKTKSS